MINTPKKSICFVLTTPLALNAFLLKHLSALASEFSVTVCVNTKAAKVSPELDSRVEIIHIPIRREINPWADLYSLFWLSQIFLKRRFNAVHTLTPKGGLLGMITAWACHIPLRTHIFTGQVWATHHGASRIFLRTIDRLISWCSTDLLADSVSQALFLEEEKVAKSSKIKVFGAGSISGVDLDRFKNDPERRSRIRSELGVGDEVPLLLFLGRLQRDKGVLILAKAFRLLGEQEYAPHLVFVGPDEEQLTHIILELVPERCRIIGLTPRPEDYVDAADLLILPSFREGFGSVIIEAAAMGKPAVASRIYGLTDAVVDGVTGILCSPNDENALRKAIEHALDPECLKTLGDNARNRAVAEFSSDTVTEHWINFYCHRLKS